VHARRVCFKTVRRLAIAVPTSTRCTVDCGADPMGSCVPLLVLHPDKFCQHLASQGKCQPPEAGRFHPAPETSWPTRAQHGARVLSGYTMCCTSQSPQLATVTMVRAGGGSSLGAQQGAVANAHTRGGKPSVALGPTSRARKQGLAGPGLPQPPHAVGAADGVSHTRSGER